MLAKSREGRSIITEEGPQFPAMEVGDLVYINPGPGEYSGIYALTQLTSTAYALVDIVGGEARRYATSRDSVWGALTPDRVFKLPEVTQKHLKSQLEAVADTIKVARFSGE